MTEKKRTRKSPTKKGATKKSPAKKKADETQEVAEELASLLVLESAPKQEPNKVRLVSLYGTIDEERAEEACMSLVALKELGRCEFLQNPEDPKSPIAVEYKPIELYISTWGGSAADMFAVYDTVRMIRDECPVLTIGMGKVMSAGVLLLASGTKGARRIGKNCRIMMHSVIGGHHGAIHNLENEMEEIRWIQKTHVEALVEETDMTQKYLNKLLDRKVNAYISAKEAVELGIADIIV